MNARSAAGLVLVLLSPLAARAASKEAELPRVGLGYEYSGLSAVTDTRPTPMVDPSASAENPLYVRIEVLWAEIEKQKGEYDWSVVDRLVDRFGSKSYRPILDLWGGNPFYSQDILSPPTAKSADAVEAWSRFVRAAAQHFKGHVRFFQLGRTPNGEGLWGGEDPAKSYAYLLKKSAVIVRGEASGSIVVSAGIAGADASWLGRLYAEGAAPYLDVVSFRPDPKRALGEQCDAILQPILAGDASARLWVEEVAVEGTGEEAGRDLIRKTLTALDHGASLVTFALPYSATGVPTGGEYLVRAHSAIATAGRVPSHDRIVFTDAAGAPLSGVRAVSFYEPATGLAVTGFWTERGGLPASASVRLTARRPGPPTLYDPISGRQSQPSFEAAEGGAKGEVGLGASPVFLVYKEGVAGAPVLEGKESVEVSAKRGISADEVIAKYREFQAAQDARLAHYSSDAMINFHFRLGGTSQTIDVGMGGSYFFDPKVGQEWELRDYYLNGNKSKWKDFPQLPLVQPEKVVTLPLDITFDRSYAYEYVGEETTDGRDCYVLSFEPVDPAATLYRGRVWIDRTTWARVRVDSIQTKLDPPFLSSEEKSRFAPVKTPDGSEYWLLSRIDGQQIYSAAGRNFIILRDITFTNPRINDPEFAKAREQAYGSNYQMLRDTDKGFRYLEKTPEGERRVQENPETRRFFGLGGVLYDRSLDYPTPLLGFNYFDFDFKKTGLQTNVFFAGVLATINATNPNFGGSGFDLGGDLFLNALKRTDREFENGREIDGRDIAFRTQSIDVNLGREIGTFTKLQTTYELAYVAYGRAASTNPRFILPKDTLVQTATLFGSYNRSGYEASASVAYSGRSKFEFWGRRSGKDFNPDSGDFLKYDVTGSKEFFLPSFQKIRFAFEYYGGSDLDRFARYSFDRFNARVRGFGGSGIRFDEGGIIRAAYIFNIANAIRFEAAVDQARVKLDTPDGGTSNHTGLGLAANVLGPWKTVWQLDSGYALKSDVGDAQGKWELLLVVLKLF